MVFKILLRLNRKKKLINFGKLERKNVILIICILQNPEKENMEHKKKDFH